MGHVRASLSYELKKRERSDKLNIGINLNHYLIQIWVAATSESVAKKISFDIDILREREREWEREKRRSKERETRGQREKKRVKN